MNEESAPTLLFSDEQGNYYLILSETLERCRLPEEAKTHLEKMMADDAGGYVTPIPIPKGAGGGQFTLPSQLRLAGGLRLSGEFGGMLAQKGFTLGGMGM